VIEPSWPCQADQSFDQALNLDPSNWEARFWKAACLSRWPAEMNKSSRVIDNLVTLVEQQETQSPQPQFVQTYVLLASNTKRSATPMMQERPGGAARHCSR